MRRSREDAFAFGDKGDLLVRKLLSDSGEYVFPNSDASRGGAPMARGKDGKIVWPDLSASGGGRMRYVEVKTKRERTYRRITGVWETGCESRLVNDYLDCQRQTGCPVHMVFVHVEQDEVLTATLNALMVNARPANDSGTIEAYGEPMTFFRCEDFEQLARLSDLSVGSRLALEGHCPPKKTTPQRTHSNVSNSGKWRTRQTNSYTEHEWVPDLLAIAKRDRSRELTRTIRAATPERERELAKKAQRGQIVWEFCDPEPKDVEEEKADLPEAAE